MWSILIFAIAQAAIDCSEYTAVEVVFVLDKSGSTAGAHYENQVKVANAILKTFRNMTQHLHWGTVTFNSAASVELDMKVDDASRRMAVGSSPGGGTHYKPALGEAKKMILQYNQTMPKEVTSVKAYIILLTDGVPGDLNTQEKMASFRNTVVKNTTIDIASAFLSSKLNNKALNLLKALSCSNVTSPDCDDHVIQRTLNSANVAQVNDDVTKLVGKLVDEKTCTVTEPPIASNPVTTSVASNSTEISGTTNSDQPKEDTSLSLLYVAAIALAFVAAIILCLCCLVIPRMKASNAASSKQPNAKHARDAVGGVRTNRDINGQKRTHRKIHRRKDEHSGARSKPVNPYSAS